MRTRQFSTKQVAFGNQEKILEAFEHRQKNRSSRSEICKAFGIVKGIFFWSFLLSALVYASIVVLSEKTFAYDGVRVYPQHRILSPPNPIGEIAMKDVFFDFNSFTIKQSAKTVLDENAEILRKNPDIVVFIQGYCDSRENTDENLGLKRAYAVNKYFVKQGVEPQRVNSVDKCNESYGSLANYESPWRLDRMVHFIPFRMKSKGLDVAIY
jgi:outer membrane protein OmpA-like peptidoglycan-associated protein